MTEYHNPEIFICSDCPPVSYPTDATRCSDCPRRKININTEHVRKCIARIRSLSADYTADLFEALLDDRDRLAAENAKCMELASQLGERIGAMENSLVESPNNNLFQTK